MQKDRFYIDTQGLDYAARKNVFKKAVEAAKSDLSIKRITLVVHTKSNLAHFQQVFTDDQVKALVNKGLNAYEGGPLVKIETIKTIKEHEAHDIICTYGLDGDEIYTYDDYHDNQCLIGLPWIKDSLTEWARVWEATEMNNGSRATAYPLPHSTVKAALDSLTSAVNLSTGIHHPSDEDKCKTYLRALHKYGYPLVEQEILSYLVKEKNWYSRHAKDVTVIVTKLNTGKSFQGGEKTGLKGYIKHWEGGN